MSKKKKKKVRWLSIFTSVRLPNIAVLLYLILFVYLVVTYISFKTKTSVGFYEVTEGSVDENDIFKGIIIRDETLYTTQADGYVSYQVRDKKRVSAGANVYYIDPADKLEQLIEENTDKNIEISEEVYIALKNELTSFSLQFQEDNFSAIYDTKYAMELKLSEYSGLASIENVAQLLQDNGIEPVITASAGTFSLITDTLTGKTQDDITIKSFEESQNSIHRLNSGMHLAVGDPVYKLVNSDYWALLFPLTESQIEKYKDEKRLTIHIDSNDLDISGRYSTFTSVEGKIYGKLEFDRFMIEYINDRFLNFEILSKKNVGLKIPKEAVVSELFFLIPKEYLTTGANKVNRGFNREVIVDGVSSIEYIPADIYYTNQEGMLYIKVEDDILMPGDIIVKPDSEERYQIGATDSLDGVYNINKGYTMFKRIEVIASDDEFNIVKKNTPYGLAVYDHILQEGAGYKDGDIIY